MIRRQVAALVVAVLAIAGLAVAASADSSVCMPGFDEYRDYTDNTSDFTVNDTGDGVDEKNCWEAGGGRQTLNGQEYADTLLGGNAGDTIRGGDGSDLLRGEGDNDLVLGGNGDDVVKGGNQDDEVEGNDGNDTLYDGQGEDVVRGGPGFDTWHVCGDGEPDTDTGIEQTITGVGNC